MWAADLVRMWRAKRRDTPEPPAPTTGVPSPSRHNGEHTTEMNPQETCRGEPPKQQEPQQRRPCELAKHALATFPALTAILSDVSPPIPSATSGRVNVASVASVPDPTLAASLIGFVRRITVALSGGHGLERTALSRFAPQIPYVSCAYQTTTARGTSATVTVEWLTTATTDPSGSDLSAIGTLVWALARFEGPESSGSKRGDDGNADDDDDDDGRVHTRLVRVRRSHQGRFSIVDCSPADGRIHHERHGMVLRRHPPAGFGAGAVPTTSPPVCVAAPPVRYTAIVSQWRRPASRKRRRRRQRALRIVWHPYANGQPRVSAPSGPEETEPPTKRARPTVSSGPDDRGVGESADQDADVEDGSEFSDDDEAGERTVSYPRGPGWGGGMRATAAELWTGDMDRDPEGWDLGHEGAKADTRSGEGDELALAQFPRGTRQCHQRDLEVHLAALRRLTPDRSIQQPSALRLGTGPSTPLQGALERARDRLTLVAGSIDRSGGLFGSKKN